MPYTKPHKQYLEAMGLVPWVLRDSNSSASVLVPPSAEPIETLNDSESESALIESMYQGASRLVHGDPGAKLLLVFRAKPGDSNLELSRAENQLLLDMLKAIKLDEASVARCLVSSAATPASVEAICGSVDFVFTAALELVTDSPGVEEDSEEASRLGAESSALPVWQLPHPSWIQQQPGLKRRAWNVLKAVKVALNEAPDSHSTALS